MFLHRFVAPVLLGLTVTIGLTSPLQATDFTWLGGTADVLDPANWNPNGNPHTIAQDHSVIFGATGSNAPTIGNTDFWLRQWTFDAGAQAYAVTGNSGSATYISLNARSFGLTDALINNSSQQQVFNITTGKIGVTGVINSGTAAGGDIVINGGLVVSDGSTSGVHYTGLAGANNIYFNVDSSINPTGNVNGGAWTAGTTTSSMYRRVRSRLSIKDLSGRAYLGNIGTSYAGTMHIDSTANGALRLTHNNSLGNAATSGNNRATMMLYGGSEANGTLELSNNISVARFWMFIDGRSGAVADDPHILNVSGDNTYTVSGDWNTGTYVPINVTADSSTVTQNSGNWNIQSDSGRLTIAGGNIYNTGPVNNTLQLMGAGDGQINAPLVAYDTGPSLNLVKRGSGKWTLTNIPSAGALGSFGEVIQAAPAAGATSVFTGNTAVNEGTLHFKPAASVSLSGSVAINDGAKLAVTSFDSSSPVVTTSALNLGNSTGGAIDFELLGNPFGAPLVATAVTASSNNSISIVNKGLTQFTPGTFALIDYSTLNDANFDTNNSLVLPPHVTGNLAVNGGNTSVDLVITSAETIRWHGGNDNVWNVNGAQAQNWKIVSSGVDAKYLENPPGAGDFVTFDDNAAGNFNVNVSTSLSPAAINFNNSTNDYTLSGSGGITTNGITKDGSGKATIANSGGTLSVGAVNLNSGVLAVNRTDSVALSAAMSGSGTFRQEGAGTTTLSGSNATYSGQMVVAAGTLKTVGNDALGTGGSQASGVVVSSGATLDIVNGTTTSGTGTEVVEISGTGVGGIGALVVTQATDSNGHINQLILNGDSKIGSYSTGATASGRSILWIDGPGAAVQGNNHNLSIVVSGSSLNGGEIDWLGVGATNLNNIDISGGGAFYIGGNTDLGSNGTLTLGDGGRLGIYGSINADASTVPISKPIVVAASANGAGIELYRNSGTGMPLNSTITLNGNLDLTTVNSNSSTNSILTLNGKISGAGNLTMHLAASGTLSRVGTFELTSNDNDYTGTTTIGGGGGKLNVLAANDRITLSVGDGGTTGKLGTGDVIVNSPGVLKFNRNDAFSVPNNISGSGRVSADAAGGIVTLTGANSYAGTTSVNAGTLLVNGAHTGGADYTVLTGATLGGTGSIASNIIVDAGGVASPGTSVGTLTTSGGATLNGTLKIEYNGAAIDKLAVGGALDITAATVDFDALGSLAGGARIFASYGSLVGAVFAGVLDLPGGFTIDYNYLGGNQIALVGGAHPGDFDSDGDVDGADFVAWQTHFPTAMGATLADGDADGDGDVDGADFVVWQTNFPFTPGPGASPVPEPTALFLGALSAIGLFALRRRK